MVVGLVRSSSAKKDHEAAVFSEQIVVEGRVNIWSDKAFASVYFADVSNANSHVLQYSFIISGRFGHKGTGSLFLTSEKEGGSAVSG